jgi:hypothetical protein
MQMHGFGNEAINSTAKHIRFQNEAQMALSQDIFDRLSGNSTIQTNI